MSKSLFLGLSLRSRKSLDQYTDSGPLASLEANCGPISHFRPLTSIETTCELVPVSCPLASLKAFWGQVSLSWPLALLDVICGPVAFSRPLASLKAICGQISRPLKTIFETISKNRHFYLFYVLGPLASLQAVCRPVSPSRPLASLEAISGKFRKIGILTYLRVILVDFWDFP